MDSEINSVLLNEMLEEDIISLSGGQSDTDLLQSDFGRNAKEDQITRPHSIIDELMDGPPTHQTQHQLISVTTPSALTSPPLPKTFPPPTIPHQSSTTTPKPTSSNQTISSSKHLPFNFYFIPNHPNYISKLNLPTNLAKLCTDIQRNAELSIITLVENYLTKRHKQKKKNKNKNSNTSSTTRIKYKPRSANPLHQSPLPQSILLLPPAPPLQDSTSTLPPQPHTTHNQPKKTTFPPATNHSRCDIMLAAFITTQIPTTHRNAHTHTHHQQTITHPNTDHPHPQPILQLMNNTRY